jgi:transposase-like protein
MFLFVTGYKNIILRKYPQRKRKSQYVMDETVIKVGSEFIWL